MAINFTFLSETAVADRAAEFSLISRTDGR